MQLKAWLLASRPKTLFASVSPVMLGVAFALSSGHFEFLLACLTLITSVFIQVLTNYVNDYYDFLKGSDTKERFGPPRALQRRLVTPEAMRRAILMLTLVCLLLGGILVYFTDHVILWVGLLSILFAFIYTAGPYPLAYHGLGEVFVILFFGPVSVLGSYYVHSLEYGADLLLVSFAPGFLAALILMVNNIRDMKTDMASKKNTLVVLLGLRYSKILYTFLSLMVLLIPFFYIHSMGNPILLSLLIAPLLIKTNLAIYSYKNPESLNQILALNSIALFIFCLLFSVGMFL